jgi:hypothetical protein
VPAAGGAELAENCGTHSEKNLAFGTNFWSGFSDQIWSSIFRPNNRALNKTLSENGPDFSDQLLAATCIQNPAERAGSRGPKLNPDHFPAQPSQRTAGDRMLETKTSGLIGLYFKTRAYVNASCAMLSRTITSVMTAHQTFPPRFPC